MSAPSSLPPNRADASPAEPSRAVSPRLPGWALALLRGVIVLALPPFLVLASVRIVMSEAFLQVEYRRPGFPADRYGFTQADRLHYAPYAIQYLRTDAEIDLLGDLTQNGRPMFKERELQHMADVKVVTQAAFRVHTGVTLALLAVALALAWRPRTRRALRQGIFEGGLFTLLLIAATVVLILANWDYFFTGFHRVFFEGNSWLFSTSDTLIRLFPEQFWFDAALTLAVLTVCGALSAVVLPWWWERRAARIARRTTGTAAS